MQEKQGCRRDRYCRVKQEAENVAWRDGILPLYLVGVLVTAKALGPAQK